jgi:hypothetical protein
MPLTSGYASHAVDVNPKNYYVLSIRIMDYAPFYGVIIGYFSIKRVSASWRSLSSVGSSKLPNANALRHLRSVSIWSTCTHARRFSLSAEIFNPGSEWP